MARRRKPEKAMDARLAISIPELARDLGLGRSFIYQEIKAGRLKRSKAGSRSIVTQNQRAAYVALLESEAEAADANVS
jgi:predicted DNA-binding transcriptional regulator AlpA